MEKYLMFIFLLFCSYSLSGQSWSAGLDLISLGQFIGGEQLPVTLQVKRSWNDRHALRTDIGMYHSNRQRQWDYLNSRNGARVDCDAYDEVNFQYNVRLGWEYVFTKSNDRFGVYTYTGAMADFFMDKKKNILKECSSIIKQPVPPDEASGHIRPEDPSFYDRPEHRVSKNNYGFFLRIGVGIKLMGGLSCAIESDFNASYYEEKRFEHGNYWIFNANDSELYMAEEHNYDEKGLEFQARGIHRLFVRYAF